MTLPFDVFDVLRCYVCCDTLRVTKTSTSTLTILDSQANQIGESVMLYRKRSEEVGQSCESIDALRLKKVDVLLPA